MRIEDITSDLNPKIDFSEWNWGDLETRLFKPIADQVAEVLWDEIVDSIKNGKPRLDFDQDGWKAGMSDGQFGLHVTLFESHYLVVPLSEAEIDPEELWHLTKRGQQEYAIDWNQTLAKAGEARAILRHWDEQIERFIAEAMDEMAKEAKK